jgi:hypothetical protein
MGGSPQKHCRILVPEWNYKMTKEQIEHILNTPVIDWEKVFAGGEVANLEQEEEYIDVKQLLGDRLGKHDVE